MKENKIVLSMKNISKEYSGNPVLKNVSIDVRAGEIHALMGENGAGKSTLMNILFGMPAIHATGGFQGTIEIEGEPVVIDTPTKAMQYGIGMVHQELMLIPGFTVAENIKIGREIGKSNFLSEILGKSMETLDTAAMNRDARNALDSVGMTSLREDTLVEGMAIGYKQFIEIAREIDKSNMRVLVFDEPTAVLTEDEARQMLDALQKIVDLGIAVIFISHRLDEVLEVSSQVSVLRDGTLVTSVPASTLTPNSLAELMVGRGMSSEVRSASGPRPDFSKAPVAVRFHDFWVDMPGERVKGIDLEVKEGEILGIGGLAGQGKLGISNGVMGMYPSRGCVEVFGQELQLSREGDALRHGVAFVSEDRRGVGLLIEDSIENNIVFSAMQVKKMFLSKKLLFTQQDRHAIREHGKKMIDLLDIRCTSGAQAVGRLSGGNQQKVCLARALTLGPKVLFVSEPTRGIDIGAKELVLDYLHKINREEGVTIIFTSSELLELRSICDRIAIIAGGKINSILKPTVSDAAFGLAMSGIKPEGGEEE